MAQVAGDMLKDYVREHPEKADEIIGFCGITHKTLLRWLSGILPRGLRQAKLFMYLYLRVGVPEELVEMEKDCLALLTLVAFEIVTSQEALTALGSTSTTDQQLWRYFRGDTKMSDGSKMKLELWLDTVPAEGESYRSMAEPFLQTSMIEEPSGAETVDVTGESVMLVAANLAALLKAVHPLAERLEADDVSDEIRAHLRALVGDNAFFKLTNSLTRLSGTQARSLTRKS